MIVARLVCNDIWCCKDCYAILPGPQMKMKLAVVLAKWTLCQSCEAFLVPVSPSMCIVFLTRWIYMCAPNSLNKDRNMVDLDLWSYGWFELLCQGQAQPPWPSDAHLLDGSSKAFQFSTSSRVTSLPWLCLLYWVHLVRPLHIFEPIEGAYSSELNCQVVGQA